MYFISAAVILKCVAWNIRGLREKEEELDKILNENNIKISVIIIIIIIIIIIYHHHHHYHLHAGYLQLHTGNKPCF